MTSQPVTNYHLIAVIQNFIEEAKQAGREIRPEVYGQLLKLCLLADQPTLTVAEEENLANIVSIYAFYSQQAELKKLALVYLDRLFFQAKFSQSSRQQAAHNLHFYLETEPGQEVKLDWPSILGQLPADYQRDGTGWLYYPTNPSILPCQDNGYWLNVRLVNYYMATNAFPYLLQTKNLLLRLDSNLTVEQVLPVKEVASRPLELSGRYRGLEDLRLFYLEDKLAATCTVVDYPGVGFKIALLSLRITDEACLVESVTILPHPEPGRTEKNWVPLLNDQGQLQHLIYSFDPLTLTRVQDLTWQPTSYPQEAYYQDLRGSGQAWPLPINSPLQDISSVSGQLYLTIVHQKPAWRDGFYRYFQRWLLLTQTNDQWLAVAISKPWKLAAKPVEFSAGLAPYREGFLVSYGVMDAEAHLTYFSLTEIRQAFHP